MIRLGSLVRSVATTFMFFFSYPIILPILVISSMSSTTHQSDAFLTWVPTSMPCGIKIPSGSVVHTHNRCRYRPIEPPSSRQRHLFPFFSNPRNLPTDNNNNNNDDEWKSFLWKWTSSTEASSPPPLTAIAIERRRKELTLLQQLEFSNDEVIDALWELWSMERGAESQNVLLQAEQAMAVGNFTLAKSLLHSLIQQHGLHWAEPLNKLATLHYMTGNFPFSKRLCQMVLQIKPWHFGALSGIVLVSVAMNDVVAARFWADRRLPPLLPLETSGNRRSVWVQRAVQDAQESFRMAHRLRNSWDPEDDEDEEDQHQEVEDPDQQEDDKDQGTHIFIGKEEYEDSWQ